MGLRDILQYYDRTIVSHSIPPTSLLPGACYDKMAEGLGGRGYSVSTPNQLRTVLAAVLSGKDRKVPCLINVEISPYSARRAQVCQHLRYTLAQRKHPVLRFCFPDNYPVS